MENIDPEEERRQLSETYGQMTEDELCALADDAYDLTLIAKEALQAEIQERSLKIQLNATPPPPASLSAPADANTPNADDEDLVCIYRLWNESEAKRVKDILDAASIPSYLGPDNVFNLEDFKSGFDAGVDLMVRSADQGRAIATLGKSEPEDEDPEDDKGYAVLCPKCHSPEVVFEGRDPQATMDRAADAKFKWNCDACGYQWEDDGVEQPV